MKKWFTLSLALVAAAVSHAVTVAWTVPNSNTDAAKGESGWWSQVGSAYFVYSADKQLTAGEAYSAATGTGASSGSLAFSWGETYNGKQTLLGTNVAGPDLPSPSNEQPNPSASGYYYMVVVNKNNQNEYAVAGTQVNFTYTEGENGGWTANKGVYLNEVGSAPTAYEYFDIEGWLGGTWGATGAPEPTVMALLALGVAGVALRRKQNLTK